MATSSNYSNNFHTNRETKQSAVGPITPPIKMPAETEFLASEWKPLEKNTLRGFVNITLPSGLRIKECSLHEKEEKRWIGLPAKPWTKQDGTVSYVSILDFASKHAQYEFQELALEAVDRLLSGGGRQN